MLSAIAACHAVGIVHRDVKPDNFLAAPRAAGLTLKLCDFGLAAVSDAQELRLQGVFGTSPFIAPEMLAGTPYSGKVDVWGLGVVAYVLLFGAWPYTATVMTGQAMQAAIRLGTPPPRFRTRPGVPAVSRPCSEWVQALLRREVASRPSAKAALRLLGLSTGWSAETSMRPALNSAKRCGAFSASGRVGRTDLDEELSDRNAKAHGGRGAQECHERQMSDVSTTASAPPSP